MQAFIDAIQADALFYAVNILAFFVVVGVVWLWAKSRYMKEMVQLKTELVSVQQQRRERLFKLEDNVHASQEKVRLILKELRNQVRAKDPITAKARRNELSNVFFTEYREDIYQFARLADVIYAQDKEAHRVFAENHILPFLQLSGDVLSVINQQRLLELCQAPALQLSYRDFDFAFDFIYKELSSFDMGFRRAAKRHAKRLGFRSTRRA